MCSYVSRVLVLAAPGTSELTVIYQSLSETSPFSFPPSCLCLPCRLTTDLILCPTLYLNQENMNILRDAAHLQMQLRHYDGLIDTRFLLLKLRPNLRQNWIGLALAYHLNGSLPEARRVLEQYECSLKARDAADVLFCALVCSSPVHGLLERARLRSRTVRLAALPRQSLGRYG
jgi:hypothetical protein